MDSNQFETKVKRAFEPLREAPIEAPPFMKARIMARLNDQSRLSREVRIWRWIAGLAVTTAGAVLVSVQSGLWKSATPAENSASYFAMQPYVIHVDLSGDKLSGAKLAEVELPEGVHFVSKTHPEVTQLRKMRLAVPDVMQGRSRLPFVVTSDKPGLAELKLKIFDESDHLIHERVLSVKFAQNAKTQPQPAARSGSSEVM